jgi:hypothetical protein
MMEEKILTGLRQGSCGVEGGRVTPIFSGVVSGNGTCRFIETMTSGFVWR